MASKPIVLEIGTEEIPARFLPRSLADIKELATKKLTDARIGFGAMRSYATPRRLALIVEDVADMQLDEVREVFGPPSKAAYDKDGNLTKAALGFARSQGVDPQALTVKPKEGKGEYLAATVQHKGQPTVDVLSALLKDVLLSINFPKSMRWGNGTMRYARPVHWVVAIYGGQTLDFDLEGIQSGNRTRGHRFLAPGEIEVSSPEDYIAKLESASVAVVVNKRMETIAGQAADLASGVKGRPVYDDELLSILACITEYPMAVLGGFDKKYLELPDELLTSVMVGHQKYIPVSDDSGSLINHFIVVSNTRAENAAMVAKGAERVIRARFDDAVFYYSEDRETRLAARVESLKNVTFQDKLGSMYDKVQRVKKATATIAALMASDATDAAVRAAELSKSDLVSGVVYEFPELQGIMGMYYARHDGEGDAVAEAVREQYLPAFSGDKVPATHAGTVLSLAEKFDNLASFFSIGLKPTGSEDPYALRRQTLGIVSILLEGEYDVSIGDLIQTVAPLGSGTESSLVEFFEQRLESMFLSKGFAHDVVQALIRQSTTLPLKGLTLKLEGLTRFKSHEQYNDFLIAIKRVRNIAPDEKPAEVNPDLFAHDEERVLDSVVDTVIKDVSLFEGECNCDEAVKTLLKLTAPINSFFDKVLVMDKDEALRNNRLSLLWDTWHTVSSLADFSKLDERT